MATAASRSGCNCFDHRGRTRDEVSAREHAGQAGCSSISNDDAPVIDLKQAVREAEVRHLPDGEKHTICVNSQSGVPVERRTEPPLAIEYGRASHEFHC